MSDLSIGIWYYFSEASPDIIILMPYWKKKNQYLKEMLFWKKEESPSYVEMKQSNKFKYIYNNITDANIFDCYIFQIITIIWEIKIKFTLHTPNTFKFFIYCTK